MNDSNESGGNCCKKNGSGLESGFTECQCDSPGHCPIYGLYMGPTLHKRCQRSQPFRDQFLGVAELTKVKLSPESRAEMTQRRADGQIIDSAIKELKLEGVSLDEVPEGLGDTVEKVLSKFGITPQLMEKVAGMKGCKCAERKKWLNKVFPYGTKKKRGWFSNIFSFVGIAKKKD